MNMLRKSISRVVDKRGRFLSPMEKTFPCILNIENRVSEKLITMCLLEGLKYSEPGVNTSAYFTEVEIIVNNGILSLGNSNWKLPVNGDTLSMVGLSNPSARTFVTEIGLLFDVIFFIIKMTI